MYCAVIGDIIDSRKILDDRGEVQERFKAAIEQINHSYSNDIESYFSIKDGDSFYGLLHSPTNLFRIMMSLRLAIAPYQIRIGIGIGSIGTEIEKYESAVIDGRANSTAKEAIDYLSENKNKYEAVYRTTMLKVDSLIYNKLDGLNRQSAMMYKTQESFINAIFCACSDIEKSWDRIHADTIQLKADQYTQREIAHKLRISQPAVQKRLRSAEYYVYEYYQKTIESGLEVLWKEVQYA